MSAESFTTQITAITGGNIEVKPFKLSSIEELRIVQQVNDHARMYLTGVLDRDAGG